MVVTWLSVLMAIIAGGLLGCASRNARALLIGGVAGMLAALTFHPAMSTEGANTHWLVVHITFFLVALFATSGIRKLIRSVSPPDEDAELTK